MSKYSDKQIRVLEKEVVQCRDIVALMDDYVDDELSCTIKARVDHHIQGCDHCKEFSATYKKTIELAAALHNNEEPVPTDVQNRLRIALNARLGLTLPLLA